MNYYVIVVNGDGEAGVERVDAGELKRRLDDRYYGEVPIGGEPPRDLGSREGVWIIKGEAVTPKPVKVVEAFEVP